MNRPAAVIAFNPSFSITRGHTQALTHWVRVSVQLRSPFTPFFFYITAQPTGACADWATSPGNIGRVGNNAFTGSTNGNGAVGARGGILGSEWWLASQMAVPAAGVLVLADSNGFCDFEISGTPGTDFYACVAFPGYSGISISRKIVSADFS